MSIDRGALLERVQELGPFADSAAAERAVRETLRGLRAALTDDEARWLADELGVEYAGELERGGESPGLSASQLYQRSAASEGVPLGAGIEHVQVVARVLGELLPADVVGRLRRIVPRLAALFSGPARPSPPMHAHVLRVLEPASHDLAQGRPGSARPLSDARPGSEHPLSDAQPDTAHRHSVAHSDDPHADTKLSSARGLTQEREGDTLADARREVE